MVQIVAPRRLALVVRPGQQREVLRELLLIRRTAAGHGAELALPDQPVPKVGEKREIVGAEEPGELKLLVIAQLPHIVQRHQRRVRLVLLPRVNRIRVLLPAVGRIDGIESVNRAQSRHVGEAVVSDSEQRQGVISQRGRPARR